LPEVYNKAFKFIGWHEYVVWKLCGEPVIDYSLASCVGSFDIRDGCWSEEILQAAGVPVDLMPRAVLAGTKVGEVDSEISRKTGLSKGTAVVVGGHDTDVSVLGAGTVESGVWMDLTGTFEFVGAVLPKPIDGSRPLCHRINRSRDIPIIITGIRTSGSILKWYKDIFSPEEQVEARESGRDVYDILMEEAASANLGSDKLLLLPDFSGRSSSKGALLGLTVGHGRNEFVRAILEGLCFELRHVVEKVEEEGLNAREFRAIGGGAKSRFWLQLKSNIVRRKFVRPEILEGGSLGASILAGIGVGTFKDAKEGVESTYREKDVFFPESEEAATYENYYQLYKQVRPMLAEFYKDLSML
jgi:xylulokinase